nr:nsp1 [Rousettus bat coronavirus HKU9]
MEGVPDPPKLKSMVVTTLKWCDPFANPNVTGWDIPIEEALEYAKQQLRTPEPQLVFVPYYLSHAPGISGDRVVITDSIWYATNFGWQPIRELAMDKDGVRYGRGGTHGVLLPMQDPSFIMGDIDIQIRKYGIGANSPPDVLPLWDGFSDPGPDVGPYLDFPDNCCPTKPKAKRGG